ncbi:MAG TPA: FAD-dependent monooxygenase [Xanthobacteraceae bacterium]|nr:FAD-dependent monooxygenase [Xanthobacteraceae bacterium]
MSSAPTILIVGAGIGGLTAAHALAASGFRVHLLEQAKQLSEVGAGLQLSPNATRILIGLGLAEQLKPHVLAPQEICIRAASGAFLARIPLGERATARYGAPYWVIHRADLQNTLAAAVKANPNITLTLDAELKSLTANAEGVTTHLVTKRTSGVADDGIAFDIRGRVLVGADGLSSVVRYWLMQRLRRQDSSAAPRYANHTAWRATVRDTALPAEFRAPVVYLWLGRKAHLVHYPVKGGTAVNIVAITQDRRDRPGWSAGDGAPDEVLAHFPQDDWCTRARTVLGIPDRWLRWPLFDRPPAPRWGFGPVTLLGDAAHPALPFLAQGAAMAIEDAAVLANCLKMNPETPEQALRRYEDLRAARTARVMRTARRNSRIYHLGGWAAAARDHVLGRLGGERLLARFDWLYDWRANTVRD